MKRFVCIRKSWPASTLVIICGAIIILILTLTSSHWWKEVDNANITCNGQRYAISKVYRSRDGSLLVTPDGGTMYIIFPESKEIGIANASNFLRLPGYVYSKHTPPPFALMSPVKSVEPNLIINSEYIEFNSLNNGRVRVTW